MERIYGKEIEEKYNRMSNTFKKVDLSKITILTGSNGSGKSLIRKQMPFNMMERMGSTDTSDTKGLIGSTSMDARTSQNPEWGALSSVMNDTTWIATSQNTFSAMKSLFHAVRTHKTYKYIIIDEFEIGCGEETALALSLFINSELEDMLQNTQLEGALIITHSRIGVSNINHDDFLNIEGMTKDEWLNRKIIPVDLDELDANELFFYIRDLKEVKKK